MIDLICNVAFADEFDSVKCNSDIPKALIGKKSGHGTVQSIEKKHLDIALKDLGAEGLAEDPYVTISWSICGNEYLFLIDNKIHKERISDIIEIPQEMSKLARALPGTPCVQNSKKITDDVYAILEKDRKVKKAWRIDQRKLKFVSIPTINLSCESDSGN